MKNRFDKIREADLFSCLNDKQILKKEIQIKNFNNSIINTVTKKIN